MKWLKGIVLGTMLLGCTSCISQPEILYKTEYKDVYIPTIIPITRPDRPDYTSKDSIPGYLSKLLEYTQTLEVRIDEYNKKQ